MKKVPTLYQRDEKTHQLIPEVNPEAQWVIDGEGIATRKYDGTAVLIRDGRVYKRVTLKSASSDGKFTGTVPAFFEMAQPAPDPVTGEWPGWLPIGSGPEDKYHREATENFLPIEGTYELVGPKINGNPEGYEGHALVRHGTSPFDAVPLDFEKLRAWLTDHAVEGIVWHHPDGRMAKIKGKDFGIKRVRVAQEVHQ